MPECMTMHELWEASSQDQHLQCLMEYIIQGWPECKIQLLQETRICWAFKDYTAVINGVVIKSRCIVIPEVLQQQALKLLYINHMGIGKTKLLACKSIYWICIKCRYWKSYEKLFYMPWVSANSTKRKFYSSWHSRQTVGSDRSGHVYFQ